MLGCQGVLGRCLHLIGTDCVGLVFQEFQVYGVG